MQQRYSNYLTQQIVGSNPAAKKDISMATKAQIKPTAVSALAHIEQQFPRDNSNDPLKHHSMGPETAQYPNTMNQTPQAISIMTSAKESLQQIQI